jgi:acyl-CoA synthetase (AMP-forming)/AMP-acid ligase II
MIFKSPSPEVEIPDISWPEYFFDRLNSNLDNPALINAVTGDVTSYGEMKSAILTAAAALLRQGYRKGDVIAIYAPNSPEFVITFQAVLLFGGIITTVNPLYTSQELVQQLEHAGAVCLFTVPELLKKIDTGLDVTDIRDVFVYGAASENKGFGRLLSDPAPDAFMPPDIDARRDVAVLPYSSGTTGLPKGVMLSHRNLVAHNIQLELQQEVADITHEDRVLAILPLFHIFGMTCVMNLSLSSGAALVILPGFDPEQLLRTIQQYRVTRAHLVPPIVLFLTNHPLVREFDISSLNYLLSGAAPLGADQVVSASQRIDCPVIQGYGMTESSPAVIVMPELSSQQKYGSVGVLVPNTQAMIVNTATGELLTINETGELLIRGPQVMLGYLNDPAATEATIDRDGWLHTGDIAYADEDGYFYIVDRLKELIKYKGYQVAPAELEALLLTHPAVADAAVVAYPDEEAGEIPRAFIVTKQDVTDAELMTWVADRVAPYKKIRKMDFIDRIPKSPSGKILRRELRDL